MFLLYNYFFLISYTVLEFKYVPEVHAYKWMYNGICHLTVNSLQGYSIKKRGGEF